MISLEMQIFTDYVSASSSLLNLLLTFRSQMFHLFSFSIFTDMNIGHNPMVTLKWNLWTSNSRMYYLFITHGSKFLVTVIQTRPFQRYFHIVPCIINSSFYLVSGFLIGGKDTIACGPFISIIASCQLFFWIWLFLRVIPNSE